ncbi:MAG: NTP transferase domain-containing protein [Bacteroidales bacterium]|nr:NTP transferase domain-containing protein [Bacteroidales bacterium]MCF8456779.1 NTP transferase domain-containing protein [Bacteroidales bacterium]
MKKSSAIILAAGLSSRMGMPKFLLELPGGKTFLENVVERFAEFGCTEIVVVLNREGLSAFNSSKINLSENSKIVENPHPEWDRFYSLQCGLKALSLEYPVFLHNVDNPFINLEVLEKLISNLHGYDFAKPVFQNKGGHPVLISAKLAKEIVSEKHENKRLNEFLGRYLVNKVEVNDGRVRVNVNTIVDYSRVIPSQFSK